MFTCAGQSVQQLQVGQIGPGACGVVLLSAIDAAPYLPLTRPVSSKGIGILVIGGLDTTHALVAHSQVRFHAGWKSTGEPLLLSATLLQVGDQVVEKGQHGPRAQLDMAPSALVRVAVFRDEWAGDWGKFIEAPLS